MENYNETSQGLWAAAKFYYKKKEGKNDLILFTFIPQLSS